MLNEEVSDISKSLEKLGFENKSDKISDYKISSSVYEEGKSKKYLASNILMIEFRLHNKLIGALYNEVQANDFKDLDISYETMLSDSLNKSTRLKLVQLAIEEAKVNAANISKSLGLKISKVKQVYKENERFYVCANQLRVTKFTPPKIVGDTDISYRTSFDPIWRKYADKLIA